MKGQEVLTVLVIEDDPDTRDFISRVLELDGCKVLQTGDIATGFRLATDCQVSLIVLDLRLPGRDGWDFLAWREKEPKLLAVPTIVFTAEAGVSQREKALRMGATEYLVKPLSTERLKVSIDRSVHDRR